MNKKTTKVNGITLVALVITIIILLILVNISITALTNIGLFEKSKEAKVKSKNAQKLENTYIQNTINFIDYYLDNNFKLTAKEVGFNPNTSDTTINYTDNWKNVKNLKEALDYLYNR